jgi:hypothetical protein
MSVSVTKIYVDMDGVIADFVKRFKELTGKLPSDYKTEKGFTPNFNLMVDGSHFESLDKMPDFDVLVSYLDSLPVEKCILSSTRTPEDNFKVAMQKMQWLANVANITWPKIFVPGKSLKQQYANPNSILIDDTPIVIEQWNAAGGIGILHTDAISTITELKKYIDLN